MSIDSGNQAGLENTINWQEDGDATGGLCWACWFKYPLGNSGRDWDTFNLFPQPIQLQNKCDMIIGEEEKLPGREFKFIFQLS